MSETLKKEIPKAYFDFPSWEEIGGNIERNSPPFLGLPNYMEGLRAEYDTTKDALDALYKMNRPSGEWEIKGTDAGYAGAFYELVGPPNLGKTYSLQNICKNGGELFRYLNEPDQNGKKDLSDAVNFYSMLGQDYRPLERRCDRQMNAMRSALLWLNSEATLWGNPSRIHLFDRSIMDAVNVWARTRFLDGSIILPQEAVCPRFLPTHKWKLDENTDYTIRPVFPKGYPWNLIICLSPVETVLLREFGDTYDTMKDEDFDEIHNPFTLRILIAQYLRMYYECLQKDSSVNVILLDLDGLTLEQTEDLIKKKILELHGYESK